MDQKTIRPLDDADLAPAVGTPDDRSDVASVVLGPKTRLGAALIERAAAQGEPVFAVARDEHDRAALEQGGATVVQLGDGVVPPLGTTPRLLKIYVCALGPVHPEAPRTTAHAADLARDLAVVESLLASAGADPVHVVLVSTVIALAPGDDRRYYGGWKALVEQELRELVESRPTAQLSVLYPGRLVTPAERRRPWHRAHLTYSRLAELVEAAALRSASSRIVGLDARAWVVAHGVSLVLGSLTGSRGTTRRHDSGLDGARVDRQDTR